MDQARRQLIAERTREAIAERKAAGTYHWPATLVDRDTVELIVGLRSRGWSHRRIARLLTAEGRPTARGGPWRHSSVRKILLREAAGASSDDASDG